MSGSGLEGLNKKSPERSNEFIGSNAKDWQHWKYPETVGNDTGVDDINFNSNQTSEYAKLRMNAIDPMVNEPFIMFEFMKVDNDDYGSSTGAWATKKWEQAKGIYNSKGIVDSHATSGISVGFMGAVDALAAAAKGAMTVGETAASQTFFDGPVGGDDSARKEVLNMLNFILQGAQGSSSVLTLGDKHHGQGQEKETLPYLDNQASLTRLDLHLKTVLLYC